MARLHLTAMLIVMVMVLGASAWAQDAERRDDDGTQGDDRYAQPDLYLDPDMPLDRYEPGGKLRWVGAIDRALAEARLRNAPIVAVMGLETSAILDVKLADVFLSPKYAKKADRIVSLIALSGLTHSELTDEEAEKLAKESRRLGRPVDAPKCRIFNVRCDDHDATYDELYNTMIHRTFWEPMVLIFDPDGNEVIRLEGGDHTLARYLEDIAYAASVVEKRFGKPLDEKTYRSWLAYISRSRELVTRREIPKAFTELDKLEKISKLTDPFRQYARQERNRIDDLGIKRLQHARALAEKGQTEDATDRLRVLIKDYAGREAGNQAKKLLDSLDG